jgi:TATA-binding protein-associated factor
VSACTCLSDVRRSVNTLVPRLFPYFRHTIAHVRLAVLKALQVFITVDRLPRSWIDDRVFRLIYQNLVVEERLDIRSATSMTWQAAFTAVEPDFVPTHILPRLSEWFAMAMTPMGVPLDASLFFRPVADKTAASKSKTGYTGPTYNVDKHMMAGDLSLVTIESVLRARIGAAEALAGITKFEPSGVSLK